MVQLLRNKKFILLILLTAALLPYYIICFYAYPFADDFCFGWTASEQITFIQKFLDQYLYWNGRYAADVLVNLHPLVTGKIFFYQFTLFLSLLLTPVIAFAFINQVLKHKILSLIVSLLFTLFYLNYTPNLTEGVYWYIGIVNYHLGDLILLMQLLILAKALLASKKTKTILSLLSVSLLIIAVGFNEIGAVLIPLFYLSLVFIIRKPKIRNWNFLILHLMIAIAASAFVIFSPGNFIRENLFINRHQLFHSLLYSSIQTIRFIAVWSFSIPFIALSLICLLLTDKIQNNIIRKIDYRIVFLSLLFVAFTGSFLPYFSTGILGQYRTINYVFFYFIFLWIIFLISVSEKFGLYQKMNQLKNENIVFSLLTISILTMMVSGNEWRIVKDFQKNNFKKYKTEFFKRQKLILENPESPIPALNIIPNSFQITDTKGDTAYWTDKCMKKYYEQNTRINCLH